jgi:hypothetical protein|tara:strand:- start:58 stop:183 length:126 start_codon:yes stop_codon:yes gene_type:complete
MFLHPRSPHGIVNKVKDIVYKTNQAVPNLILGMIPGKQAKI